MPIPQLNINISGNALAFYGAILSTATAIVQVLSHLRDRAKIVITVRKNMKSPAMGRKDDGMTMVIITATNVGRRPVTIAGFAAGLLFDSKRKHTDFILFDVRPPLPCEITEGKEVAAFVNQEGLDFNSIACWYAWDTARRHYSLNVAPWHKRRVSKWKQKHADKTEDGASKVAG